MVGELGPARVAREPGAAEALKKPEALSLQGQISLHPKALNLKPCLRARHPGTLDLNT